MKKMFCALFAGLCLLWAGAAGAEVLRASPDGMSLTEALALAKDGDRIELADGVYTQPAEAFPLTVQRAVTVCAAQEARPVIDAPAFLAAFRVEADGVTFRGLDVRMRRTGFYALGDDMTVEDCAISLADPEWRTSSCGIWVGGIHRAAVRGCAFTGCSIAMAGPPLSETSHLVPVLTGLFEVGEDVDFFTSHTISDCTVNGKPLFYAVNEERVLAPPDAGQVIIANCAEAVVEDAGRLLRQHGHGNRLLRARTGDALQGGRLRRVRYLSCEKSGRRRDRQLLRGDEPRHRYPCFTGNQRDRMPRKRLRSGHLLFKG